MTTFTVTVPSATTPGRTYTVHLLDRTCSCPDFVHRHAGAGTECKHLRAVFTRAVPSATTPGCTYTVHLLDRTCSCPDFAHRHAGAGTECKHLRAVAV